ncbi:uncharacterized protein LOC121926411 [Sceloporus undulatus]|uniref:uncharacterized protein LOC121926411 n=1 Tax=Sceloporus undulatus TaxID=8520 RepID=UPI001C4C0EEE|nr:uncharacterized protein LOC121926411 [Sceloporus undulatus]
MRRKGPPSTVSVPPPDRRTVATPIPASSSAPPPLEPRVLLAPHLSIPDEDLQIVTLDHSSESEGEIPDSDPPASPRRLRSPSKSSCRARSPLRRDRAALGTEADEALNQDRDDRDLPDRDLFDTYPDLVYDHHSGQYFLPVDPSHLRKRCPGPTRVRPRSPWQDTTRKSDDLFMRRPFSERDLSPPSRQPSRYVSRSPSRSRSPSPFLKEDQPYVLGSRTPLHHLMT